jgi:hypothetical protein
MGKRGMGIAAVLAVLIIGLAYFTHAWLTLPAASEAANGAMSSQPPNTIQAPSLPSPSMRSTERQNEPKSSLIADSFVANAASTIKIMPVARSIPNSNMSAMFTGAISLANIYKSIIDKPFDLRTADDWHLLMEVMTRCQANEMLEREDWGLPPEAKPKFATEAYAPRVAARQAHRDSCAEIPVSEFSTEAINVALAHLSQAKHPAIDWITLRALTEMGFALQSHDQMVDLLADPNPLLVKNMGQSVAYEINLSGLEREFNARGINVGDFEEAWRLAACDLAGGCAPDQDVCVYMGRCDSASPLDYYRRYEPERFGSLDALRQRIVDSYRNGDWRWLDLPTVRGRLPGNKQTGSMAHLGSIS